MPEISNFFGLRITMYYNDHNPPHFHAEYEGRKVLIDIEKGTVLKGALPNKQTKLLLAWCEIHREELLENWEISKENGQLFKISPLR